MVVHVVRARALVQAGWVKAWSGFSSGSPEGAWGRGTRGDGVGGLLPGLFSLCNLTPVAVQFGTRVDELTVAGCGAG